MLPSILTAADGLNIFTVRAAAHIFQLLMVLQLPIVAFFAIRWLPRAPKAALRILALQAAAGLAAMAPVYFAGL